ncbi:MAG: right-handed parallel beta-helix repeat-containing protein [Candidatus Bathyarchaeia archaeon]|jgi:hypothetical protein
MVYPAKYPPVINGENWNAMVDAANGMIIASGVTIQYPFSYVIRNVGGVYDAVNGNGVLTYGGSSDAGGIDGDNAAAVIQAAINATADGTIYLKKGRYILTSPLTLVDKNIILAGDGWGRIYDSGNETGTILVKQYSDAAAYFITVTHTEDNIGVFSIRDLAILCDKTTYTGGGIYVNGAFINEGWELSNLRIRGFTLPCLKVEDAGKHTLRKLYVSLCDDFPIYYDGCGDWQWYDVEADIGGATDKAGAGLFSTTGQIIGGHFEGFRGIYAQASTLELLGAKIVATNRSGIYLSGCNWVTIMGCAIANPNRDNQASDGSGVTVYNSTYVHVLGNKIVDVSTPHYMRYAVQEVGASCLNNVYKDNIIEGNIAAPFSLQATDTIIENGNSGFRVSKSGVTTITGAHTSGNINHGLYDTPTGIHVTVTDNADDKSVTYYLYGITSTKFTVDTLTDGNYTIRWTAFYNPI